MPRALELGIATEIVIRRSYAAGHQKVKETVGQENRQAVSEKLENLVNILDNKLDSRKETPSCVHSILCECQRRRCPGRVYSIKYYANKVMKA